MQIEYIENLKNKDFSDYAGIDAEHFGEGPNYPVLYKPPKEETIKEIHELIEKKCGYKIPLYISTGWYQDRKIEEKDYNFKNIKTVNIYFDVKNGRLTGNIGIIRYDIWG